MFFVNDTATTEIYTLSLHDALPISQYAARSWTRSVTSVRTSRPVPGSLPAYGFASGCCCLRRPTKLARSEEHTSELQSRQYLVCRLLLEKKKKTKHL